MELNAIPVTFIAFFFSPNIRGLHWTCSNETMLLLAYFPHPVIDLDLSVHLRPENTLVNSMEHT